MASAAPAPAASPAPHQTPLPQLLATCASLEADLRNLLTEARRKYPDLQTSGDASLGVLRGFLSSGSCTSSDLQEAVLRPMLLACATKAPKLPTMALTSVQRLVSLSPLAPRFLSTLLGALRIHAEDEEPVQLKVLQTLLLCISPSAVECGELLQGSLLQALSICFRLFLQKKSPTIHHTAFAALRQLISLLFERVAAQSQQGTLFVNAAATTDANQAATPISQQQGGQLPSPLEQLSPEAQNAFLLFSDLCVLADPSSASAAASSRPRYLTSLSAPLSGEVCVELLENILASTPSLFSPSGPFFLHLVKQQLAPLLVKLLRSHFEFAMVLRVVRCVLVLTRSFANELVDEVEIFLSLFIRMLHAEFPLWHRVLVMETILQLLHARGDKFAYWMYQTYDVPTVVTTTEDQQRDPSAPSTPSNPHQTRIFTSLVHALSRLVVQTGSLLSEGGGASSSASLSSGTPGSLGVGSSGTSSAALLTQASANPTVLVTLPSSPMPSATTPQANGGGGMSFSKALATVGVSTALIGGGQDQGLSWKLYTAKGNRGLDLLNLDLEGGGGAGIAGLYEEAYVVTLGLECLVTLVNGFAALAKTNEKWGGSSAVATTTTTTSSTGAEVAEDGPDLTTLRGLCDAACLPILGALSYLLNRTNEEAPIQHVLMCYQSFTNTCGVLVLQKSRDAFLQNLAGFALPKNGLPRDEPPSELIKTLFGVGTLGTLLTTPEARAEFQASLGKILLAPKHIQALKALFNVAHCLGRFLGASSWLTLLETFQTLDTMIQISTELTHRLAREAAFAEMATSLLPHQTEINIMAAALSRLFESTRYLDDQAVTHVLSALGTLSLSSLANAATTEGLERAPLGNASTGHAATLPVSMSSLAHLAPPQTMRMFALVNLCATLEHNLFRITSARLWDIGVGHLTCVINHKDAAIRQYGVAALTKITILALAKHTTYQQAAPQQSGSMSPPAPDALGAKAAAASKQQAALLALSPGEFQSAIQASLLYPLHDLFRSKYEDTRENILRSLYQVLQNGGQHLVQGGWKVVLAILQSVVAPPLAHPASEDDASISPSSASSPPPPTVSGAPPSSASASASFINVGFNSIQLITNDYLESVPFSSLAALIETISAYCAQVSDTNISFTSIGLLWRVSDYMGRSATVQRGKSEPSDSNGGIAKEEDGLLSAALADSLMHLVFASLVTLCTSARTEVRNSAVKTLHNTLVAHAARMSFSACLSNLGLLVLPLLARLLTERLEESPQHGVLNNTELGKDRAGKAVMMLVHYSRDTASKQWDETRGIALQGTARVIKAVAENLLRAVASAGLDQRPELVQAFLPHWLQFLELNLLALSHRSSGEISLSALNSVLDLLLLLCAPGPAQGLLRALLWPPVLERFYTRAIVQATMQHRHLEWVERRERLVEADIKERRQIANAGGPPPTSSPLTVDHASSPFATAAGLGDLPSEEGWKSWLKTHTHLLGHFQTLLAHAQRIVPDEPAPLNQRDDLIVLVSLSHALVTLHGAYGERKAVEIWTAKQLQLANSNGANGTITTSAMPDRKETPIQSAHLKLLEALTTREAPTSGQALPVFSPALWATVFLQLLGYLQASATENELLDIESHLQALLSGATVHHASVASPATAGLRFPSSSFAKRVLRVFSRAYSGAPSSVRALHFAPVLPVLRRVIGGAVEALPGGGGAQGAEMAEEAVATFIQVLDAGLKAMNDDQSASNGATTSFAASTGQQSARDIWLTIVDIFGSFLAPPSSTSTSPSPPPSDLTRPVYLPLRASFSGAQQRVWETLQIALVGALLRIVFPQVASSVVHGPQGDQIPRQLVAFFNIGYDHADTVQQTTVEAIEMPASAATEDEPLSIAAAGNELLSHTCLMALFQLVRLGGVPDTAYSSNARVAGLAAPLLLSRCRGILSGYLALERSAAPSTPMPRPRREEMGFMLRELADLEVHPEVAQTMRAEAGLLHAPTPASKRAHLLALFPVLCQCITMRESELRELLRDVFLLAASELGLAPTL